MISTAHEQPPHLSTQNTQDAALIFIFIVICQEEEWWLTVRPDCVSGWDGGSDGGCRSVQTKLKVQCDEGVLDHQLQKVAGLFVRSDLTRTSVFDVEWRCSYFLSITSNGSDRILRFNISKGVGSIFSNYGQCSGAFSQAHACNPHVYFTAYSDEGRWWRYDTQGGTFV